MTDTLFEAFVVGAVEYELRTPAGDVIVVQVRALTADEMLEIRHLTPKPEPPVEGYHKFDGERALPIYAFESPGYNQQLEAWVSKRTRLMIVRSLVSPEIPGNTDDEKIAALSRVSNVVLAGLNRAVSEMNLGVADDVKRRPFPGSGTPLDEGDADAGMD